MSDIVIKTEHLSKYYNLGVINNGTLFRDLQTWWALKRGKKDPHSRVGENKYDSTKEGFWALKDLDIEIKKGDRVGIIGKNGAGKSTLLKILSRITAPTEGIIKIKGRVASLLEVGTGFHGELTGRENIYLNGAILGMKRHEVDRKIDEIIAFSEIEQHIDTPVKRYSSGMYVRLAFAVAAHLDSEILIADEVLAVGDASFQKKALGKMNDLSTGEGRTVLFVSHNMSQIKSLCTSGIVLQKGMIAFQGPINDTSNFYLQNKTSLKKIIDLKKEKTTSFHVDSITINDSESCVIFIPLNSHKIFIKIKGETENPQKIDVMVIFKTTDGIPIATFSPGHYEGKLISLGIGKFTIESTIELPEYYGHGRCIASIYLHNPGIEGIVDFDDAVQITFEGAKTEYGNTLTINESGLSFFKGVNIG